MATKPKSDLIERVRVALRSVPEVRERRMFGSTGFMIRDKLAIAARAERIMCRVDPRRQEELLERPGCRAVVMRGRTMKGYLYVDASAVTTAKALDHWIVMVLHHNRAIAE